tara:strand:- start:285 stop:1361 length:1077 start_codon:yes stop_codon:yes gene_type:complete
MEYMRLEDISSFVRSLNSECTVISNHDDYLIVGSKEGLLICWSINSGIEKWRNKFEGPCSELIVFEKKVYLTEEGNVHSIDLLEGKILWSLKLEGLSDFVQVNNGDIWVSSSIYDLHISNYSESIIWHLDRNGKIIEKWIIEGKPWFFCSTKYGVCVGLSRPKCGYGKITPGKKVEYVSLKNENPITAGFKKDQIIYLGHSNGLITVLNKDEIQEVKIGDYPVKAIEVMKDMVIGLESGMIYSKENNWEYNVNGIIDKIVNGPLIESIDCLWVSTWTTNSIISIIDVDSGALKYHIKHNSRIRKMKSNGEILVLGDSEGKIFLIEEKVLNRRLKSSNKFVVNDEKRSLLKERIRKLRD